MSERMAKVDGQRGIKINEGYFMGRLLLSTAWHPMLYFIAPTDDDLQKQIFDLDKAVTKYGESVSAEKKKGCKLVTTNIVPCDTDHINKLYKEYWQNCLETKQVRMSICTVVWLVVTRIVI